jgi:hypothetical protein
MHYVLKYLILRLTFDGVRGRAHACNTTGFSTAVHKVAPCCGFAQRMFRDPGGSGDSRILEESSDVVQKLQTRSRFLQSYYRKAVHLCQLQPSCTSSSAGSPLEPHSGGNLGCDIPHWQSPAPASMAPPNSASPPLDSAPSFGACEAEIAYKIACCYSELQDWHSAIAELESVPVELQGPSVHCMLGGLHRRTGNGKLACAAYKVLHPTALTIA